MLSLDSINGLVISQRKEWGEILTGFETKNTYVVRDPSGGELFVAIEEGGSMLLRWFLKAWRPFEMHVRTFSEQSVIRAVRPFRWYFHEVTVYGEHDKVLGTIKREFAILRRIYSVFGPDGTKSFQLFGPILHPWTFEIRDESKEYGRITKKWSGLLKEGLTDADNFGITFPREWLQNKRPSVWARYS